MKSDYEKLTDKLNEVGAECCSVGFTEDANFENRFDVELWDVGGKALILLENEETNECGLYLFVGNNGDLVENDLEFIEKLAKSA